MFYLPVTRLGGEELAGLGGGQSTPLSCQSLPAPSVPHQRAPAVVGAGPSDRILTQRAIGEAQGLLPLPLKAHRLSPRQPKKHRIWAHGRTRAPFQPREEQRAGPAALCPPRWEGGDPELGERPRAPSSLLSTSCLPPSHPRGGQPCPYLRGDAVRLRECPQSTFFGSSVKGNAVVRRPAPSPLVGASKEFLMTPQNEGVPGSPDNQG